jgi:hypothetical protein
MSDQINKPFGGGPIPVSILQAASLYSPLLTMISILIFSIFSSALNKGLFYIMSVFFVTAIRIFVLHSFFPDAGTPDTGLNAICNTGVAIPYTGQTYSTFLLTFTVLYFVAPMFILSSVNGTNMINYGVVSFFTAYIIFDIFMKKQMGCFSLGIGLVGDFLVGGLFGVIMALTLFYSDKISLLFINELNSNKEVCSVPSKQQFRCSLYRNGTIVGSSVSA